MTIKTQEENNKSKGFQFLFTCSNNRLVCTKVTLVMGVVVPNKFAFVVPKNRGVLIFTDCQVYDYPIFCPQKWVFYRIVSILTTLKIGNIQEKKGLFSFSPVKKPKNKGFSECYYSLPTPFYINATIGRPSVFYCALRLPKCTLKYTHSLYSGVDMRRCWFAVVTPSFWGKKEPKSALKKHQKPIKIIQNSIKK